MKCPKCKLEQNDYNKICDGCQLVFEKYYQHLQNLELQNKADEMAETEEGFSWQHWFFPEQEKQSMVELVAKSLLLFIILGYSIVLICAGKDSNHANNTFLHLPNLVFHEAGHVVFSLFGQFIGSLGGTLAQFLMPGICFYVFFFQQRNVYASAIVFWWFAENFIDIAPYVNDARAGVIPLIGGNIGKHAPYGFHDWQYLLTEMGLIQYDTVLASLVHILGSILMLLAVAWGGLIVYQQYNTNN